LRLGESSRICRATACGGKKQKGGPDFENRKAGLGRRPLLFQEGEGGGEHGPNCQPWDFKPMRQRGPRGNPRDSLSTREEDGSHVKEGKKRSTEIKRGGKGPIWTATPEWGVEA